ncbi:MAG: hypothetical protein BIFFINMI_01984 [Phycisphaerae bacterium]|nr:hypothetical protein [Phycisphaerae bacterium]
MSKSVLLVAVLCLALGITADQALSRSGAQGPAPAGGDLAITLSPATFNLAAPVDWITVHTNIPLSQVDADSVTLAGLAADQVFADDRGNLVVKVDADSVAEIVQPPSATLTLALVTVDGVAMQASATLAVIDCDGDGPRGPAGPAE